MSLDFRSSSPTPHSYALTSLWFVRFNYTVMPFLVCQGLQRELANTGFFLREEYGFLV